MLGLINQISQTGLTSLKDSNKSKEHSYIKVYFGHISEIVK